MRGVGERQKNALASIRLFTSTENYKRPRCVPFIPRDACPHRIYIYIPWKSKLHILGPESLECSVFSKCTR